MWLESQRDEKLKRDFSRGHRDLTHLADNLTGMDLGATLLSRLAS